MHLAFLAGAVLTTLGLAALTSALVDSRGRVVATIGLILFLLATSVRVLQTIFAATVTVTAAHQAATSGAVPSAYGLMEGFLWGRPNWALAVLSPSPALAWPASAAPCSRVDGWPAGSQRAGAGHPRHRLWGRPP